MNALDAVTTNPPTCTFCGTTQGPFDVEDVYPLWTREVLPVPTEVIRTTTEGAQPWHRNVLAATLKRAVCKKCNGGWMSQLEHTCKPLLRYMMNPEAGHVPVQLDETQQKLVAFWANLKAVCLELSLRQSVRGYTGGFVAPGQFKWLYDRRHPKDRTPPASTQVWLFGFQAQAPGSGHAVIASHRSVMMGGEANELEACLSTFTIGCLGLQVFTRDLSIQGQPERLVIPGWLAPVLVPISPIVVPVAAWLGNGPNGVLTPDALGTLVTWGSTFQPTDTP